MYLCSKCGKGFTRKFNLSRHEGGRCNGKSNPLNTMFERKRPLPDDCPPDKSHKYQEKSEEESSESEQSLTNSDDESKISTYTWRDNGSINRKHPI